ncbi:MAG: ribose-5-phosphate isomerase RpiA [Lactobacillaceae bacterium]|jgi:ribose 5-phosphate isomerase A|nr:ribose-5-phosphate isomerase RpiA [Lactobacillaceae bacterium]
MDNVIENKKRAGEYAASLVEDGMVVGLGTGSTVRYFVEALARRVRQEGMDILGFVTSGRTAALAEQLGIRIHQGDSIIPIDITIDGADSVDANLNGIKGGGAALLYEKIIATNSKRNIWVVDETKIHDTIWAFPLPVEVVPYGSFSLLRHFEQLGLNPTMRMAPDGVPIATDAGHYIIDLKITGELDPKQLAKQLKATVGVVDHGLFLNVADEVIVGGDDLRILKRDEIVGK